jgi:type II secretory pathway pseudopilin PulG
MKNRVVRKGSAGFYILELLVVGLLVAVITVFVIVRFRSSQVSIVRVNAAQEFVDYLEQARLDSNRRQTKSVEQMACVTVVDNRTYSYMMDANSDGRLDPPQYVTIITTNNLRIKGPFPKTFRYDGLGRIVDLNNTIVEPPLVVFANSKGTSTVRLSADGKPVVVHGLQPGIGIQR